MRTKTKSKIAALLAGLMICANSWGAMVPTAPTLTIGPRTFTDLTNLITLYCYTATSTNYTTCRKAAATSGYQITAGKTYTIYAMEACNTAGAASNYTGFGLLYGDTDVGLNTGSTAPTNPIRMYGGAAGNIGFAIANSGVSGKACGSFGIDFAVPATKYVAVYGNATQTALVILYGYEN